ncbi:hypothetical protein D3C77_780360 [compost metagenome]
MRHLMMRLRLQGMDQVRKFDGVLDEKYGNIVADQIIVAFLGIELRGKPPSVTHRLR